MIVQAVLYLNIAYIARFGKLRATWCLTLNRIRPIKFQNLHKLIGFEIKNKKVLRKFQARLKLAIFWFFFSKVKTAEKARNFFKILAGDYQMPDKKFGRV